MITYASFLSTVTPETLTNIINQISVLPNIEAHKLLLNDALKEPFCYG